MEKLPRPSQDRRVVVTGLGVLTSIGIGVEAFAANLRAGESGIRPITTFDAEPYRCSVGGEIVDFDPVEKFGSGASRRLDRASLLVLSAAWEALELASLEENTGGDHWAAVLGTTLGGMLSGEQFHRQLLVEGKRRPSLLLDFPLNAPTDRLCSTFGIRGTNFTVSSACASGGQAVGCAFDLIRSGQADVALAGGVDTMAQLTQSGFGALKLLIQDGESVRPFDKNRTGFALGEGAAVFVLEEMGMALDRGVSPWAEIKGFGLSNDAFHPTAPRPDGRGSAAAMAQALERAGLEPGEVGYINAHGTGTRQNDVSESRAIQRLFGQLAGCPPVSSTKSMIGHTLGASGAIGLAATVLAMRDSFLPPTINYETPDPDCPLDFVPNESREADVRVALANSLGFGGVNCCLAVSRLEE